MPGRCPVGHRTHRAGAGPNFEQPRQSILPVRRRPPAELAAPGGKSARHRHSTGILQMPARPPYGMLELAGTRPDTKYPDKNA